MWRDEYVDASCTLRTLRGFPRPIYKSALCESPTLASSCQSCSKSTCLAATCTRRSRRQHRAEHIVNMSFSPKPKAHITTGTQNPSIGASACSLLSSVTTRRVVEENLGRIYCRQVRASGAIRTVPKLISKRGTGVARCTIYPDKSPCDVSVLRACSSSSICAPRCSSSGWSFALSQFALLSRCCNLSPEKRSSPSA